MKIIHLAAELAPYAKAGGLGDVIQGLAQELTSLGHSVEVVVPAYAFLKNSLPSLPFKVTCIQAPGFDRDAIYGYEDDVERFAVFTKKACEYIQQQPYDIVHAHDWHTALSTLWLSNVILTIHNLAYFGACSYDLLQQLGLSSLQEDKGEEGYSLLRLGIVHAKKITTVSKTYAKEILQGYFAGPFQSLLQSHQAKLIGILNGLDTTYWDPNKDPYLPDNYQWQELEKRQQAQDKLLAELNLPAKRRPIVAAITRLVWQKGPELLASALEYTHSQGGMFILLGSGADPQTQERFIQLKQKYPPSSGVFIQLCFDEALAHKIYCLADLILVPSRYEPCGLTQLIGMRYGALPIVRQTGGLSDTVKDKENGFVFDAYEELALQQKIAEALHLWKTDPQKWKLMQISAMQADYSWRRSAQDYLDVYNSVCKVQL